MKYLQYLFTSIIIVFFIFNPFFPAQASENLLEGMTAGEAMELLDLYYFPTSTLNHLSDDEDVLEKQPPINNDLQENDFAPDEFFIAKVIEITKENRQIIHDGYIEETQDLVLKIISGEENGKVVSSTYRGLLGVEKYERVDVGDKMVMIKNNQIGGPSEYYILEPYRIGSLIFILVFFIGIAIFFGRKNGLGAILGLGFSILILVKFIIPNIIKGNDPLIITLSGTFIIASVSLFLAHGFKKRTGIALLSTTITLILSLGLSKIFVHLTYLYGQGTEEAFYLQVGELAHLDLRGLLLAGIVIGTLGVLDDITTAQTAVVGELHQANPSLTRKELYSRAIIVGREHIASLVNTLVLAYAGTSLPLFVLFLTNTNTPFWININSERISEEIIRSIIGSLALILAVPIATGLAACFLKNEKIRENNDIKHIGHIH